MTVNTALPLDCWSEVVKHLQTVNDVKTLSKVCRTTRVAVHDYFAQTLKHFETFAQQATWGSRSMQYLLQETRNYAPIARVQLIFNEVKKCSPASTCESYTQVMDAIAAMHEHQAHCLGIIIKMLVYIDRNLDQFLKVEKLDLENLEFKGYETIRNWLVENQDRLDSYKRFSISDIYPSIRGHLVLPSELVLFKNLQIINILSINQIHVAIPHVIKKKKIQLDSSSAKFTSSDRCVNDFFQKRQVYRDYWKSISLSKFMDYTEQCLPRPVSLGSFKLLFGITVVLPYLLLSLILGCIVISCNMLYAELVLKPGKNMYKLEF